jgi:hypothetical protein
VQKHVRALEELIAEAPQAPPGIGHNNPPEAIDAPLSALDTSELMAACEVIKTQPIQPADKGEAVKAAAAVVRTKMQKARAWMAGKGELFADEAVKEAGKQFGKWAPRAFWLLVIERMFCVTETVTHWIKMIFPAL